MLANFGFNIWSAFIFAGSIQGILFAAIILFKEEFQSKANQYIAFAVLALSLSNLQYWLINARKLVEYAFFEIPFHSLIVPMFYLFIRYYLKFHLSEKIGRLFYIPFLLGLLLNILVSFNVLENISQRTLNNALEYASFTIALFLLIHAFLTIKKYDKTVAVHDKIVIKAKTTWLKNIVCFGIFLAILWFIQIRYTQTTSQLKFVSYYPIWLITSLFLYWISYVGVFNSRVLKERQILRENASLITVKKEVKETNKTLFLEIVSWIVEEKVYVNPNLSISEIATKFQRSNNYISQLWNANSDVSFNDYINKLRVETAKQMLANTAYHDYTILSIAYESGFNSKSSFYKAFKKFLNKTPLQYKKDILNS